MENKKRILVVDDEDTLCEALRYNLESEGYLVDTANSAEEALGLKLSDYNLILLDIMMGEISGTQLARIIKSSPITSPIPIIFCTAKDTEDDMIAGLDLGADDYISKPYSMKSLLARVRAVLRRMDVMTNNPLEDKVEYEGLLIIPSQKQCFVDGNEVKLPRKEYEILLKLLSHPGRVYSRETLLSEIWPDEVIVVDRVIDVHIAHLRQKIGAYGKKIVSRSGYGYGFMV